MGYTYVPYSSLESIVERNKKSYYLALRKTQGTLHSTTPDFSTWILFFLRALQKQKVHLEQKITRERVLLMRVSELSAQIINLIYDHGKLKIAEIEKLTQANRNTLKKHLNELVTVGTLLRMGKGKATW